MSVTERIQNQLASDAAVLYMKGSPEFPQCGFSSKVVQILGACNAKYTYINIFEDPEVREGLKVYSNWPTYPQLYIKGELVGGCDIVTDLYTRGELTSMLANAGAVQ
ncbi:Grx4 family monothiol glutaredoxin [Methylomonas sp. MED-D]|uniref:Glutaredoxin n=1 Tax=Methylomonas koyamae TaxID=702114 RepID=A0A177P1Z5_9GAMM|nr:MULTISPECIES: Grx4 family monothiol glutaredoxin [Methylomonas]NJA07796.1 Grx4 family monothiol glutaredoxin [Methylococcaceae bacterium WWC4]MDT4330971.1 Grx4 family monothiol glutaredoxin [Methylomonas sp. MV1]OAI23340.1 monothiol glutaredoxin, Grx4 family [Methylomonas koyamae]OHX34136.1 monothiol glutaredoxin, Grx4 family [Methylomonas sp. LWB]WGS84878.1 Grx4 family monothiol glutaredoxin [Methylomonas sp. UP202]